jgi:hypothetical protein
MESCESLGKAAAELPHSKSLLRNLVRNLARCALGGAKTLRRDEQKSGNSSGRHGKRAQRAVPLQETYETCLKFATSLFFLEASDFGVARFENVVDEITALVIGQEGALHCVDGKDFKVVQRQAKGISGSLEFFGHRGVAH